MNIPRWTVHYHAGRSASRASRSGTGGPGGDPDGEAEPATSRSPVLTSALTVAGPVTTRPDGLTGIVTDLTAVAQLVDVGPFGVPVVVAAGGVLLLIVGIRILASRRTNAPSSGPRQYGGDRGDRDGSKHSNDDDEQAVEGPPTGAAMEAAPRLRTDEERVIQLLIANHGRMRQSRIVEETDWSKAKVSRLLSRMEERDQVDRTRAGRENIVQLADANLSASP